MKWLLILTTWNSPPFGYDVSRYEVKSSYECFQLGSDLSTDLLTKIPGIRHVHFTCVEKGYGR